MEALVSINDLAFKYRLDKCERLHDYARFYEFFLGDRRNDNVTLLEIGTYRGDSLRMWNEYFPNSKRIVGVDITDWECTCKCDCHDYQFDRWSKACKNLCEVKCPNGLVSKCLSMSGISAEIGDASDLRFLDKLQNEYGTFDVIIDDGSHLLAHQQASFDYLFGILNDRGIYVIEDLHTSYYDNPKHPGGGTRKPGTTVEFLKDRIDDVNLHGKVCHLGLQKQFPDLNKYEREIDSITFCKSLVFIIKNINKVAKFQKGLDHPTL
jgi:hypothetical protein